MVKLRHTIFLIPALWGCREVSSPPETQTELKRSTPATSDQVTSIDEQSLPTQAVHNPPDLPAVDAIELREMVSRLAAIDDEDSGKFSTEKQERWDTAFRELQKSPDATTAVMLQLLKSENAYSRACAADVLGKSKDATASTDLVKALRDHDPIVRSCAALALAWIGDQGAVPALVEAMGDEHRGVREQVANALGHLASAQATRSLITAIKEKGDGPTCGVYAPLVIISMWRIGHPGRYNEPTSWALAQIGPPALEDLRAALEDPAGVNHAWIAWSLAEITKKHGDLQGLRILDTARDHAVPDVQEFVVETLNEIKASNDPEMASLKELIDQLDQERKVR